MQKTYRFDRNINGDFYKTLKTRVNQYFTSNNISRTANTEMVVKTIVLIALYFLPLIAIMVGVSTSILVNLGLWMLMGIGAVGIGFCVMHDANHGAYSKVQWVNSVLGGIVNILGINSSIWKYQHNVLHHSFTNIEGADGDVEIPFFLRFTPHQKQRKMHKYQHLYAWLLYGFLILMKVIVTDFTQAFEYRKLKLVKTPGEMRKLIMKISIWKVVYFGVFLVLPMILAPVSPWVTLLGFLMMQYVLGMATAIIFQLAHIMPQNDYPLANEDGLVENSWAVHQLSTTTNFAPKNRLLSWYVGGLNFQVEHHLFPNICHVHYRHISKIVKETAQEFNVPYNSIAKFREAVGEHARMLYLLGNAPTVSVA